MPLWKVGRLFPSCAYAIFIIAAALVLRYSLGWLHLYIDIGQVYIGWEIHRKLHGHVATENGLMLRDFLLIGDRMNTLKRIFTDVISYVP